jgi:hypothetical protein
MPYTDFDISIERVGQGTYRAMILAPARFQQRATQLTLDFDSFQKLNQQIETITPATRAGVADTLRTLGRELYSKLFSGDLATDFATCQATDGALRIRLSFPDRPELWQIPWEMLCSPYSDLPLAQSRRTSVVRWLSVPPQPPLAIVAAGPLRLLVISSSVGGDAFDATTELGNLKRAVQPLVNAGSLVVETLATPTFTQFIQEWQRAATTGNPYHLLHITGHGIYRNDSGFLVFSDGRGGTETVSTDRLAPLLSDDPPYLIFLNLCEGATAGDRGAFSGVAQNLIRHRVPCVIGMQFSITNPAAEIFSERFYQALAWGGDVENAVILGRQALIAAGNGVEWVTPILLLQEESLRIMANQPVPAAPALVPLAIGQKGELATLILACPSVASDYSGVLANIQWASSVRDSATLRGKVLNLIASAEDYKNGWQQLDATIALFDSGTISYDRFHEKLVAMGRL